ncbi:protein of unknown function [Microbacterium sp. Nx66]|nr:protein of unknown function [Microbacterium sp. Nx66]
MAGDGRAVRAPRTPGDDGSRAAPGRPPHPCAARPRGAAVPDLGLTADPAVPADRPARHGPAGRAERTIDARASLRRTRGNACQRTPP